MTTRNPQRGNQKNEGKQKKQKTPQPVANPGMSPAQKLARTAANKAKRIARDAKLKALAYAKKHPQPKSKSEAKRVLAQNNPELLAFVRAHERKIKRSMRAREASHIAHVKYMKDVVEQMYTIATRIRGAL
jgi:CO dehydrogenase nickel-insertion accessory protein CooC1